MTIIQEHLTSAWKTAENDTVTTNSSRRETEDETKESACWNPYREGQINALDRVQKKAARFTNHTKDSDWETLAQRRTITRLCALFKAYSGERA